MKILSSNVKTQRVHKQTGKQYVLIELSDYQFHRYGGRIAYNVFHLMFKLGLVEHAGARSQVGKHGDTPVIQIQLALV